MDHPVPVTPQLLSSWAGDTVTSCAAAGSQPWLLILPLAGPDPALLLPKGHFPNSFALGTAQES